MPSLRKNTTYFFIVIELTWKSLSVWVWWLHCLRKSEIWFLYCWLTFYSVNWPYLFPLSVKWTLVLTHGDLFLFKRRWSDRWGELCRITRWWEESSSLLNSKLDGAGTQPRTWHRAREYLWNKSTSALETELKQQNTGVIKVWLFCSKWKNGGTT